MTFTMLDTCVICDREHICAQVAGSLAARIEIDEFKDKLPGGWTLADEHETICVARLGGVISLVGVPQHAEGPIGFDSVHRRRITLTSGAAPARAYIQDVDAPAFSLARSIPRVFARLVPSTRLPRDTAT